VCPAAITCFALFVPSLTKAVSAVLVTLLFAVQASSQSSITTFDSEKGVGYLLYLTYIGYAASGRG